MEYPGIRMTGHLTITYVSNNSDCDIVFYNRGLLSFHKKQLLQELRTKYNQSMLINWVWVWQVLPLFPAMSSF